MQRNALAIASQSRMTCRIVLNRNEISRQTPAGECLRKKSDSGFEPKLIGLIPQSVRIWGKTFHFGGFGTVAAAET